MTCRIYIDFDNISEDEAEVWANRFDAVLDGQGYDGEFNYQFNGDME